MRVSYQAQEQDTRTLTSRHAQITRTESNALELSFDLPIVEILHLQCMKFITGVKIKLTQNLMTAMRPTGLPQIRQVRSGICCSNLMLG